MAKGADTLAIGEKVHNQITVYISSSLLHSHLYLYSFKLLFSKGIKEGCHTKADDFLIGWQVYISFSYIFSVYL